MNNSFHITDEEFQAALDDVRSGSPVQFAPHLITDDPPTGIEFGWIHEDELQQFPVFDPSLELHAPSPGTVADLESLFSGN
jgi:hypothetical protein